MKIFRDKVCVVTGAGSGIGRALAVKLAERGARLAISDIDSSTVQETATLVSRHGTEVEHYALDVSDGAAVLAHADRVGERFGSVNLVVNNAGVSVTKTVLQTSLEDFEWLMGINFWGVVHGTRAFLPKLIASGDGHLVNMSSILGFVGFPHQAAYSAAKFAVRGFSESLRQELLIAGTPVQVSCVHPGRVRTGLGSNGRSEDAAPGGAPAPPRGAPLTAEKTAALIIKGVERNRPRIIIGRGARALYETQRALGASYQGLFAGSLRRLGAEA